LAHLRRSANGFNERKTDSGDIGFMINLPL
jgi:hypothetical protein